MNEQSSAAPASNTAVHPTHTLVTERDLQDNVAFTNKHPYLARDIRENGFKVCKNCGRQNVENLGEPCSDYRPTTRRTAVSYAVEEALRARRGGFA